MTMIGRRAFIAGVAAAAALPARADAKPRVVVTGDMGIVGTRLKAFLSQDYDWTGVDKKRGDSEDLASSEAWVNKFLSASVVVHLAWDVPRYNTPEGMAYNLKITETALQVSHYCGVERFIFASSAWAQPDLYGRNRSRPVPAIYSESKRAAEDMLRKFNAVTRMPVPSIRFGQVNPASTDQQLDPDFDGRVLMTDADLRGLLNLAMHSTGAEIIGPFDARQRD